MGVLRRAFADFGEEPVERLHASELSRAEREPTRMTETLTRFIADVRLREPGTEERERPRAILVQRARFAEELARPALVSTTTNPPG